MQQNRRWLIYLQSFLGIEFILLVIAFLMPVTGNKTGKKSQLADRFFDNPGYIDEVLFYWIFGNIIMLLLAATVTLWWKLKANPKEQ